MSKKLIEKYEVMKLTIQFECTHGVWPVGAGGSICYCTFEERAEFVAKALEMYTKSINGGAA